jgi:molybdopterin synthase sulfur carrier subunit
MATAFQIPRVLRQYCAGVEELRLQGETVREVLDELNRRHPSLFQCICDETGAVRRHINLFVNNDFLRDRNGLDTRLAPGDVVSVFQAVSGG